MFFRLAALLLVANFLCCTGFHMLPIAELYPSKESAHLTPLLARVDHPPQAFFGSDTKYHLAYELTLTNYNKTPGVLKALRIKNPQNNLLIQSIESSELSWRLVPYGTENNNNALSPGQSAVAHVHLIFDTKQALPSLIVHELEILFATSEPSIIEQVAYVEPTLDEPIIIGAPLKGNRFVAADSCCDSTRHVRAGLPINGMLKYAQRFAVDYEQIDAHDKIYKGSSKKLTSFNIYGQEALAVAHGVVVKVIDNIKESNIGSFPTDVTLENADGNSVIIKIAPNKYALYAHLQPHSIIVREGDQVVRGQKLALVGNSGNSLAPHLHFQVMDAPSALNANGLPYLIDSYVLEAVGTSTEDFDKAESSGVGIPLKSAGREKISHAFPMDLSVLSF